MAQNFFKTFAFLSLFLSASCTTKEIYKADQNAQNYDYVVHSESEWYPLYTRLKQDGISGSDINAYFEYLDGNFSQVPMGSKVRELYNNAERREKAIKSPKKTKVDTTPNFTGVPRPWYRGFVTEINAQKCRDFIYANQTAFTKAEELYHVPQEVLSALLYIETKHATFLGSHQALITLASMSNSTRMEQIPDYIEKLPRAEEKKAWILEKMHEKSDWAYDELKALISYCRANNIDPSSIPCSIYGAIGYGQFMPTNIPLYAVDGDDDAIINLFTAADAIMSTAHYLSENGWNTSDMTQDKKLRALKHYNWSNTYANTILALSVLTAKEM